MLTTIQWTYLFSILLISLVGGYFPFAKPEQVRTNGGFPQGEAFSSGVFLALSLTMLLPSAFQIFRQQLPELNYPIGSVIAIIAFLSLLAMEHMTTHAIECERIKVKSDRLPARIPLIMTSMIALPSFFLGTTLGMSDNTAATLVFIAIILHKGTAAFALMLTMVRSTLTRSQTVILFTFFASSTPLGILLGGFVHKEFAASTALVKATMLSLGAGTFLYMGTLHEMKHASLIEHCGKRNCFLIMVAGLVITAIVRFVVGEAHHF
ncbi:ZIP family metal transporter [Gimesia aquarii]|uniref:ZIP Zinc transporter n=1 Tax=Gimesia aquarii TaxID=2527964 RepID=A0A517WX34_9PLAN|nr:ZIP family metal transporter [Gimesia aquarii]QDU09762.1 ZIP Zinc transporter [Gimesia aquarii]